MRDNDLARLADETAILLNGAILLIGETIRRPLAVAIEDERFVHRHFEMMREKVPGEAVCLLSVEVLRAICEKEVGWLAHKHVILIDNIRKPYAACRRSVDELQALDFVVLDEKKEAGISLEPDFGVFQGGSVVISAVQFAMNCGPETIGLFGIDIGNAAQPRFYEKKGGTARSGVAQAQARIVSHLGLAQQVASRHGQTFRNYSAVSVLCDYGFPYDSRYFKAANNLL